MNQSKIIRKYLLKGDVRGRDSFGHKNNIQFTPRIRLWVVLDLQNADKIRSFLNSCLKKQLSHRKLPKSKTWSETSQKNSDFNQNLHASRYIWNQNFDPIWGHGDIFLEVLWRIFVFRFFQNFPKILRQLFRNDWISCWQRRISCWQRRISCWQRRISSGPNRISCWQTKNLC